MTTEPCKLSDLHLLLLSTAANRPDHSLLPPPETLGDLSDDIRAAIGNLIAAGFAEEFSPCESGSIWRRDGKVTLGLRITDAGLATIATSGGLDAARQPKPPRLTKRNYLMVLLERDGGATLADLTNATGWLPHTVRAALSGLRKRGHDITRSTIEGVNRYQLIREA